MTVAGDAAAPNIVPSGSGAACPTRLVPLDGDTGACDDSLGAQTPSHGVYNLIPGRIPETESFGTALGMLLCDRLPSLPSRLARLLGNRHVQANLSGMCMRPRDLTDMLQMRMGIWARLRWAIRGGFMLQNVLSRAEQASPGHHLPNPFDYSRIAAVPPFPDRWAVADLGGGVSRGWPINSALTADQRRNNQVLGEVLTRLANNGASPPGEQFVLLYDGDQYTNVRDFVGALLANGYEIHAQVQHRAANFIGLHVNREDGKTRDVACPLFIKTGVTSATGQEAVLPMSHAELCFTLSPPPADAHNRTAATVVQGAVQWSQGAWGTEFAGSQCTVDPPWVGGSVSDDFQSVTDSAEALILAAQYTDVVGSVARDNRLPLGGYGFTGVCNDSVGFIQHALGRRITCYPMLPGVRWLRPELERRVHDAATAEERKHAQRLLGALLTLPTDRRPNATTAARAAVSLPYRRGQEPFYSTVQGMSILRSAASCDAPAARRWALPF